MGTESQGDLPPDFLPLPPQLVREEQAREERRRVGVRRQCRARESSFPGSREMT